MITVDDQRMLELIPGDAVAERLATGATWSEGPVYLPADGSVVWSDIPNNRMLRWSPTAGTSVFREPSIFTNGNTLDQRGRIVSCSHGQRAITRTEHDGTVTVVVDRWHGKRLNSPNDLVVRDDDSIWFTDPPYGIVSDREGYRGDSEIGANWVYRYDPHTEQLDPVVTDVEEPNGLAFSPDGALLYVADTSAALRTDGSGNHHIRVYRMSANRALDGRLFAKVNPGLADGFRLDRGGNLFTSSADSIQVYAPDGTRLGAIPIPEKVSNCCWGGAQRDELYVTAGASLYRVRTTTVGAGLLW